MLEITQEARKRLKEFFKGRESSPIRIYLAEGGWAGPSFMLALDEHRKTDEVFEIDGFLFVVDKNFFNQYQPIKVDFNSTGYEITAAVNYGKSYFRYQ